MDPSLTEAYYEIAGAMWNLKMNIYTIKYLKMDKGSNRLK